MSKHCNERVVTTAGSMEDCHPIKFARLCAAPSGTFEDDDRGFGEPTPFRGSTNSFHERSACPWSIAPPPGGSRPDHIRRIDEKHDPSLTHPRSQDSLRFEVLTGVPASFTYR